MRRFWDPDVGRQLLASEGETVIDEVTKHWVTRVKPVGFLLLAGLVSFLMPVVGRPWYWFVLVVALGLLVVGVIGAHRQFMDRFVITTMRLMRVHGILDQQVTTMPVTRVVNVTVSQPAWGRILDYGHLQFETVGPEAGLHEVTYVARPEERSQVVQRAIRR